MVVNRDLEREHLLRREIASLSDEFRGTFAPEMVERSARESLDELKGVRVPELGIPRQV